MQIVIRVDSSLEIGTGHVMRCLVLADMLRQVKEATVSFVCRELPGNITSFIRKKGYNVHLLLALDGKQISVQNDAAQTKNIVTRCVSDCAWLIVDHYSLDKEWESLLRTSVQRIMVIDDLANRPHTCNLLLDQNLYTDMDKRYKHLVPSSCRQLLGPQYVLLRSEFKEWKGLISRRLGNVKRIMAFFSGSDPTNETLKTLRAIQLLDRPDLCFDVVCGAANPHQEQLFKLCRGLSNVTCHTDVSNMAEMMARSDLGIGAGGVAMWERCYLGLPSITMVTVDNQLKTTEAVAEKGAIIYIGRSTGVGCEKLADIIVATVCDVELLKNVSDAAFAIMVGHGLSWIEDLF